MGNIITARSASHWYHPDGTPCYEVPNASKGGMRNATLKDARKLGLLPSVTTLQAEINKEFLNAWRVEQGILAALANPLPRAGETHEDHMARIAIASDSVVDDARQKGVLIHAAAEAYLLFGTVTEDSTIAHLMAPFYRWAAENIERVEYVEKTVINAAVGYAGKLDSKLVLRGRGRCIVDIKSRKRNSQGRYLIYDENGEQLSAYREADALTDPRADRCVSILINSKEPDLHLHEWPEEDMTRFYEAFKLLARRWSILKGYTPPGVQ